MGMGACWDCMPFNRGPVSCQAGGLTLHYRGLKTIDKRKLSIRQQIFVRCLCALWMVSCTLEELGANEADPRANKKKDKDREKKFIWNHGITLPLKNVRKRRFRKTAKKKILLCMDLHWERLDLILEHVAEGWEIIAEDESKEADHHGSLTGLDISSPGMSGHKQGHGSSEHDELREIFNDISSSSEDEDERDHHDDEDLNIMDTEEDLERRLQGKLNESDGQPQENEGTNQIALGIQKQIDNLKDRLQETQERRKRQEDLIMRVENLALKTRLQAVLDEFKQQEEREKQELVSLQEQLEALMEK
uniref:Uncharacterized protein n=1 Tax=Sphaerodactylus townsendi TaxID=933632 RepID=A0ACB8FXA0_9SAUR